MKEKLVREIIERQKQWADHQIGADCTEAESAEIKMFLKEHLVQIGNGDVQLIEDIQHYLPVEYGEAFEELGYDAYKTAVEDKLMADYGIGIGDSIDEQVILDAFNRGDETPASIVEWVAQKHDLSKLSDIEK